MPASTQPAGSPQSESPGVLLTAFRASLTDQGLLTAGAVPFTGSVALLPLDKLDIGLAYGIAAPKDTWPDEPDPVPGHSARSAGLGDDWRADDSGSDLDVDR